MRQGEAASLETMAGQINPEWTTVGRIVAVSSRQKRKRKYLIKWQGLPYDEATWEEAKDVQGPEFDQEKKRFSQRKPIARQARSDLLFS